jgi:hypothetical protein
VEDVSEGGQLAAFRYAFAFWLGQKNSLFICDSQNAILQNTLPLILDALDLVVRAQHDLLHRLVFGVTSGIFWVVEVGVDSIFIDFFLVVVIASLGIALGFAERAWRCEGESAWVLLFVCVEQGINSTFESGRRHATLVYGEHEPTSFNLLLSLKHVLMEKPITLGLYRC